MNETTMIEAAALRDWLVAYVGAVLDLDVETISTAAPFDSYGFDSVEAVIMAGVLEEEFSIRIDPTMVFDDPSIDGVVSALHSAGLVR